MTRVELVYRATINATGEVFETDYSHEGFKSIYRAVLRHLKDYMHGRLYYDMECTVIESGMLIYVDNKSPVFVRADYVCTIGVSVMDKVLHVYIDRN